MPRTRRIALAAALLGACGAAAGSALAADQRVAARDQAFTPEAVGLQPGDTLTIRHDDGPTAHDLQFEDEATRRVGPGTGWTVQRTFTAAEQRDEPYTFFCSLHMGMTGRAYVNATGTVPAPTATATATATVIATATASATASPGATAAPGPTGTPPAGTSAPAASVLRSARIAPRACLRCRRPGARLRIDLSAPADVRGTLRRKAPGTTRYRAFGTLRFGRVPAGPRTLVFTRTAAGKKLKPGRYRLDLRAAGARRTLAFRVL